MRGRQGEWEEKWRGEEGGEEKEGKEEDKRRRRRIEGKGISLGRRKGKVSERKGKMGRRGGEEEQEEEKKEEGGREKRRVRRS